VTKWHRAMANKGIKVLAMGPSPREENRRAKEWYVSLQQNTPG